MKQEICVLRTEELHTAADIHPFTGFSCQFDKATDHRHVYTIKVSSCASAEIVVIPYGIVPTLFGGSSPEVVGRSAGYHFCTRVI